MAISKRLAFEIIAVAFALAGSWYASTAIAQAWQDNLGSYADSNPLLIPGGTSTIQEWKSYE